MSPNSHSSISYIKQKQLALVRPMNPTPGPQIQTKRNDWCSSDSMGRLNTLIDFSPAGSSLFLLTDVYFVTIVFSKQSWLRTASVWTSDAVSCLHATLHVVFRILQVFHGVSLVVFSHNSADYCIMIAHLTSNSFEGNSCWPHFDYLPSLRLRYSFSYHIHREWIHFSKHRI